MQAHLGDPDRLNAHVRETRFGLVRLVHVAETDEQAVRQARSSFEFFQGNMSFLSRTRGASPRRVTAMGGFDTEVEEGRYLAGSPESVCRQVEEQVRKSGCNYFVGAFATGNMTSAQILTSMSLFAQHVMPAVQIASADQPA